jgi:hypothetical protein
MKPVKSVEMVREIRDKIYKETKNLKGEALYRYFKEKSKWTIHRSSKAAAEPVSR